MSKITAAEVWELETSISNAFAERNFDLGHQLLSSLRERVHDMADLIAELDRAQSFAYEVVIPKLEATIAAQGAAIKQLKDKENSIARIMQSGTAESFLKCDDDTKKRLFAMAVDESTRRQQAQEALAAAQAEIERLKAEQPAPAVPDDAQLARLAVWKLAPAFERHGYRVHMTRHGNGFGIVPRKCRQLYHDGWRDGKEAAMAAVAAVAEPNS